jgi:hypothetical protein
VVSSQLTCKVIVEKFRDEHDSYSCQQNVGFC